MLGREGEDVRNENGKRTVELCIENDLMANTKFKHKDIHRFTREVHNRKEKLIRDFFW